MQTESLKNTGPTLDGGKTCEKSGPGNCRESMSSVAEIPAKQTVPLLGAECHYMRATEISSSGLLMSFARELWLGKIQATSGRMLPGLGGDSELALNRLVTLACPSDSGRVALALTTSGSDCSCSVNMPTPTAQAWKGGTAKDHPRANRETSFAHWWARHHGRTYPSIEVIEAAQGFPATWTELEDSETQSARKSRSGSENE